MVNEIEPNNSVATAQNLNLGLDAGEQQALTVNGTSNTVAPSQRTIFETENNNSIGTADATGIISGSTDAVSVTVNLSNTPTNGDVDMFRVSSQAGQIISVDATGIAGTDTYIEIFDSNGNLVAENDDIVLGVILDSSLSYTVETAGDYFIAIHTFGTVISDPNSTTHTNQIGAPAGSADVVISQSIPDNDYYAVDLNEGDILGAALDLNGGTIQIFDPSGNLVFGSSQNAASFYGSASQLPGVFADDATAAVVANTTGTYNVLVTGANGAYDLDLNVHRTVLEEAPEHTVQYFYLDFDGHTMDASTFGEPAGSITFDPLVDFLGNWGLNPADEFEVIDAIIAVVQRILVDHVAADGNNPNFEIVLLNSRDDTWVDTSPHAPDHISRLIVGGTIADTGISTIGLAENIDVGNFDTDDTAFVLLDLLSEAAGNTNSINSLNLAPGTTIIEAIGEIVGTIVAHEAGHILGAFHTENENGIASVIDQGGLGVTVFDGADNIYGNGDDPDIRFGTDEFEAGEGFTGDQDTLTIVEFGASGGTGVGYASRPDLNTVFYTGDDQNDQLNLFIDSLMPDTVVASSNQAATLTYDSLGLQIELLEVDLGNGSNSIQFSGDGRFTSRLNVTSGNGVDNLNGTLQDDTFVAGAANDFIMGSGGDDIINGGGDTDTSAYSGNVTTYEVLLSMTGALQVDGSANSEGVDTLTSIERLEFSDGTYSLVTGTNAGGTVVGDGLDSILVGGSSADYLLDVSGGDDILFGGGGNDQLQGSGGADAYFGGEGLDEVRYNNSLFGVVVNLQTGSAQFGDAAGDTFDSIENLSGSNQADIFFAGATGSSINGNEGNDRIHGFTGIDTLIGGGGVDTLDYSVGATQGSTGFSFGISDIDGIYVRLGGGELFGSIAAGDTALLFENLVGTQFNDWLIGTNDVNELIGGAGNDWLLDLNGDDTLEGGAGNDWLQGGAGADVNDGGNDIDRVRYTQSDDAVVVNLATNTATGGHAEGDTFVRVEQITGSYGFGDTLIGDFADNLLEGLTGNDRLNGGSFLDTDLLAGGLGFDIFEFSSTIWGVDYLTDFEDGIDRIDLTGSGLTLADFNQVDTAYGLRLDYNNGLGDFQSIVIAGLDIGDITAADFV